MSDSVSDNEKIIGNTDDSQDGKAPSWPTTPSARHKARRFALQALYTWQIGGESPNDIEAYYRAENDMRKTDVGYFHELFRAVIAEAKTFDAAFANFLDRPVRELDPIELMILRIAAFELLQRIDIPPRVAINEGIELAKAFGATDDSHKYINGVLDKLARKLRAAEFAQRPAAADPQAD